MKEHNIKSVRLEVDGAALLMSMDHDLPYTPQMLFDDLFRPALLAQGFAPNVVDSINTGETH